MHFTKLGLIEPLARAVRSEGYVQPTPIQQQAIPNVLAGRDILGCAQTGTGKTAAFALPILQLLSSRSAPASRPEVHQRSGNHGRRGASRTIRALIVAPTRELAAQIGQSFATYGQHTDLRHTVVFGGVGQGPQAAALRAGVDILVATPGRLLDLLNQRLLTLGQVEILVLDEADRMLDMGFIHDIRKLIAQIPPKRQTLLYSATMPAEIRSLANSVLHRPVHVHVPAESPAADTVEQSLYFVEQPVKPALLEQLLRSPTVTRALVFTRTKHGADRVVRSLYRAGIAAEAIHSNKSQNARTRALENFRRGKILALVASDIAARGLDVDDISHVINYDMPADPETYVHRIGRTGRAGARGQAITFCTDEQRADLRSIERLLGRNIHVEHHKLASPNPPALASGSPRSAGQTSPGRAAHRQPRSNATATGHATAPSGAAMQGSSGRGFRPSQSSQRRRRGRPRRRR